MGAEVEKEEDFLLPEGEDMDESFKDNMYMGEDVKMMIK